MDLHCVVKPRHIAGRAQQVRHQRAPPGARLGKGETGRYALVHPSLRQRDAQKFAKHLCDFGRGGEIAGRAKGITGGVIAVGWMQQAFRHIVSHGNRADCADAVYERLAQAHCTPRRLLVIIQRPKRIIGSDRIWPMVRPMPFRCRTRPSGLPSETNCASGWRTNSTRNRASP